GFGLAGIQSGYFEGAAANAGARPVPSMPAVKAALPQPAVFMNSRRFDPRSAGIGTSFEDAVMARSTTRRDVRQGQDGSERADCARTAAESQILMIRVVGSEVS